jgi:Fe-S cluster assembly protein SufD
MAKALTSYDTYRSDFRAAQTAPRSNGPAWLRDLRKQGFEAFDKLRFPTATRGNERWKYTNIAPLGRSAFDYRSDVDAGEVSEASLRAVAPWDESWTRLVFVDGIFAPRLSSGMDDGGGIQVTSLARTAAADGLMPREHLGRYARVEEDGFTAINTAFTHDGAIVSVPDDGSPGAPVHLLFASTGREDSTVSYPRTLIMAGVHSSLTVLESYVGLSDGRYFTNAVTEIVAEEGAKIEHYRYLTESPSAYHIGTTRVRVGRDAAFNSTGLARGAKIARNDLGVRLSAPGSSCVVKGLYFTSGSQHIDNHVDIDHAAPHASSDQLFKGILDGQSRAVFSGRVLVRQDAQKSYARQSDKNLLLSKGARVNTKPSLEIFADDVQCFHGATAGAVSADALFYLRSRGLSEESARRLLIAGFADEIIDEIGLRALREHMNKLFDENEAGVGALAVAS